MLTFSALNAHRLIDLPGFSGTSPPLSYLYDNIVAERFCRLLVYAVLLMQQLHCFTLCFSIFEAQNLALGCNSNDTQSSVYLLVIFQINLIFFLDRWIDSFLEFNFNLMVGESD